MTIDKAKLYIANNYPRPANVTPARWRAIIQHFKTNGLKT